MSLVVRDDNFRHAYYCEPIITWFLFWPGFEVHQRAMEEGDNPPSKSDTPLTTVVLHKQNQNDMKRKQVQAQNAAVMEITIDQYQGD